jgi:hypothetical protein
MYAVAYDLPEADELRGQVERERDADLQELREFVDRLQSRRYWRRLGLPTRRPT